jgi:2-oxoglutarate ferredoxin oxidoreductase subunit beta
MYGTTAPYGNLERSFDLCELAKAAGATYVGRATAYHVPLLIDLISAALDNEGFSVVEALEPCPTYYGRKNKLGGPVEMLEWYKENAVNVKAAAFLSPEKTAGKILIGELYNAPASEYTADYDKLIAKVQRRFDSFQGGIHECESNSD